KYSYSDIDISGSAAHDLYIKYYKGVKPLKEKRSEIFDEYIDYLNPNENKESLGVSKGIEIITRINQAAEAVIEYNHQFRANYSNSYVALQVTKESLSSLSLGGSLSVDDIENIKDTFSNNIKSST